MLKIRGDKLIKESWNSEKQSWEEEDVSYALPYYLFEPCVIEGATLGDILRLMKPHLKILSIVLNNWVEEFIKEAEREEIPEGWGNAGDLDYLELSYYAEWEEKEDRLIGHDKPDLSGHEGEDVYSVSFMPMNLLTSLPVKLGGFKVFHSVMNSGRQGGVIAEYEKSTFTLGQILHGIVWEMSWYGPPEERNKKWEKLNETLGELDDIEWQSLGDDET